LVQDVRHGLRAELVAAMTISLSPYSLKSSARAQQADHACSLCSVLC